MSETVVRTRIAPSPTGDPHVGTAYMGLVNLVLARQHGGQFILRIDDTDRSRYRAGAEEAIFAALRWLGLEWDEGPDKGGPRGPYRQSERTEIYREHVARLVESGKAYPCFCTKEELDAMRAEQLKRKETPRYDRRWRGRDPAEVERRLAAGDPHVIRLAVPLEGATVVEDLLRGPITIEHKELQDQVLLKADGFPTYHLASVVDDHLMGITHIIRAEEWISSGPLHKLLFEAFGWEMPVICHMPLIRNDDKNKSKISKRRNPTSILYYRDSGFLPQGFLNFVGLLGWGGPKLADGTNQEVFSFDEMVEHFRLEKLSLGGPVFDLDKLRYLNGVHQRALSLDDYCAAIEERLLDRARLRRIAPLIQPRARTLGEFFRAADFFFADVSHFTAATRDKKDPRQRELVPGLIPKKQDAAATWFALTLAQAGLEKVSPWEPAGLEAACRALATEEETGWKARDLFMSLRVAVTGKGETPPLFETMELLGRSRCLGRLSDALRALGEPSKKAQTRWQKARKKAAAERARQAAEGAAAEPVAEAGSEG